MLKNKKKKILHNEDDFLTVSEVLNTEKKKKKRPLPSMPEKKQASSKLNSKNVFYCVLAGLLAGLISAFLIIDTGVIGLYKKNFWANIHAISSSLGLDEIFSSSEVSEVSVDITETIIEEHTVNTIEQNSNMLPFENASLSQIELGNRGLVVAKSNYLAIFDKEGKVSWETQTSVIEPILRTEGEFILLAEKGGTKICLYENEKLLFTVDDENQILNAQLSVNGDIALVTKKPFYKNAVSVYNKNGEQIFSWSSGTDTLMSADISGSTRRIAVSLTNTDERVKSNILLFDINKTEPYHNIEFSESLVFKIQFMGERLNVLADNRLTALKTNGNIDWDEVYNDNSLVLCETDRDANRAVVLDENNIPKLNTYSKQGNLVDSIQLDILPDYVDIKGKNVLYNSERFVVFGHPDKLKRYIASMDIKDLKIIDDNSFVIVYNNSLEFATVK